MPELSSSRSATSRGIMFLCNTTAIKDWSYFLSQILPLVNKSAGFVHRSMDRVEAVTSSMVSALEPDLSGASGSRPPPELVLQHSSAESAPPPRAIALPRAVLYLLMAALVLVAVAYAIVGHLLKDLLHECVEWVFGPRSDGRRSKSEVACVSSGVSDMSRLDVLYNHSEPEDAGRPQELVVTISETARNQDALSGT